MLLDDDDEEEDDEEEGSTTSALTKYGGSTAGFIAGVKKMPALWAAASYLNPSQVEVSE